MNEKSKWLRGSYSLPAALKAAIAGPSDEINVAWNAETANDASAAQAAQENGTDGKTTAEAVPAEAVNAPTVSTRWGDFHRADEERTGKPCEARNGLPGGGARWHRVRKTQLNDADEKPTSEDLCRAVMSDYAEILRPVIEERDARPVVEVDLSAENRAQEEINAAAGAKCTIWRPLTCPRGTVSACI